MSDSQAKLQRDLVVLTAMAEEMDAYLMSEVLFWPLRQGGLPKLTLGGYLLREHRLLTLQNVLSMAEQTELETAVTTFNQALVEKIVRFEQRAHQELGARLRQWQENLRDWQREQSNRASNYNTAVSVRAMITVLVERLQMPPYQFDTEFLSQITLLDNKLRDRWLPGDFAWSEEWQSAYPKSKYWWLYGQPR